MPERVRQLVAESSELWDEYIASHGDAWAGFVPADHESVFEALSRVRPYADAFLEWGSGLGTIAIMARLMGFRAAGIEIDRELVGRSRELARRYEAAVEFVEGTFVPEDYDWPPELFGEDLQIDLDGSSGYEELGQEIEDFDVIYAYPWPGEEDLYRNIFERYAHTGAVLILYHSEGSIELYRRKRRRRR